MTVSHAFGESRIPLSPRGRELRLSLCHERRLGPGTLAFEMGTAWDAGHVPGRGERSVGIAWFLRW